MRRAETLPAATVGTRPMANVGKLRQPIALGLAWLLTAGGLMVLSGCQSMPGQIVTVHESKYQNIDQTCDVLKSAIEAHGFSYKGTLNLNDAMAKHDMHLARQVRVVQYGRAKYAHDMLVAQPAISAFMPCRFGVYEGDNGTVYVSSANTALIAQMFGGVVAEVMGKDIVQDQADILKAVGLPVARSEHHHSEGICRGDPWCEMYVGEYSGK